MLTWSTIHKRNNFTTRASATTVCIRGIPRPPYYSSRSVLLAACPPRPCGRAAGGHRARAPPPAASAPTPGCCRFGGVVRCQDRTGCRFGATSLSPGVTRFRFAATPPLPSAAIAPSVPQKGVFSAASLCDSADTASTAAGSACANNVRAKRGRRTNSAAGGHQSGVSQRKPCGACRHRFGTSWCPALKLATFFGGANSNGLSGSGTIRSSPWSNAKPGIEGRQEFRSDMGAPGRADPRTTQSRQLARPLF